MSRCPADSQCVAWGRCPETALRASRRPQQRAGEFAATHRAGHPALTAWHVCGTTGRSAGRSPCNDSCNKLLSPVEVQGVGSASNRSRAHCRAWCCHDDPALQGGARWFVPHPRVRLPAGGTAQRLSSSRSTARRACLAQHCDGSVDLAGPSRYSDRPNACSKGVGAGRHEGGPAARPEGTASSDLALRAPGAMPGKCVPTGAALTCRRRCLADERSRARVHGGLATTAVGPPNSAGTSRARVWL